ncbi:MAG: hypothetical protein FWC64_02500 [Treponema sp.]|nr:hypothetical protein [Treponema sp.]
MKNLIKLFGIIALVAIIGFSMTSCMTVSSIGGTVDAHGLISGASAAAEGATEIASFNVFLGLFTAGYAEYAAAVRAAIDQGSQISSITTWFIFFTRTTAFAR